MIDGIINAISSLLVVGDIVPIARYHSQDVAGPSQSFRNPGTVDEDPGCAAWLQVPSLQVILP
jgi:hypothetical protein